MEFDLPGENDPLRVEVRSWLRDHANPAGRQLAEAGYVAPHWPKPWGLNAGPMGQLIVDDELRRAGVDRPINPIGIGWAGPTLLHAGTEKQQKRYLGPLLSGEEIWCQLFSEPGAGSDLAALATRAERDGETYVVKGQKTWTTLAQVARFGILLARTDPEAPRHRGLSYFICPMEAPGVTVRPIVEMTGESLFNEVFLDEVRIPAENLVGRENEGWSLARVTLANERVSLSGEGALWGRGPTAGDVLASVRVCGGLKDAAMRQRVAQLYIESEILHLIRLRTLTAAVRSKQPGPEASVRKALADEHGQRVMAVGRDLAGTHGMMAEAGLPGSNGKEWTYGYLFSPALTIGGGTAEVQRNIIAEAVLGLPRDPDPLGYPGT